MSTSSACIFVRNADRPFTTLEDAVVFLDVESGDYLRLSGTALAVWNALAAPCTLDQLVGILSSEYRIDRDRCLRDTEPFLAEMIRAKLVYESAREGE